MYERTTCYVLFTIIISVCMCYYTLWNETHQIRFATKTLQHRVINNEYIYVEDKINSIHSHTQPSTYLYDLGVYSYYKIICISLIWNKIDGLHLQLRHSVIVILVNPRRTHVRPKRDIDVILVLVKSIRTSPPGMNRS